MAKELTIKQKAKLWDEYQMIFLKNKGKITPDLITQFYAIIEKEKQQ